jgi:stalled ribosome alternative rescue factor ArfA
MMRVSKHQLRRIIREEKQKVLAENKIRSVVRQALLEKKKKKKKKKKGKSSGRLETRHKPWNWWVMGKDPNEGAFRTRHASSSGASQPLFGGDQPLPEEEWGQWFIAPEEEGLGSPEEQYDIYVANWDKDAAQRDLEAAEKAERAAYEASPEGQEEERLHRSMYG